MSESGEDARLQRFIERERMGLNERVVVMVEIKSRFGGRVLYTAKDARDE